MSCITYGQQANKIREAMNALGITPEDTARVVALVALLPNTNDLDRWAIAALIVPVCTVLGPVPSAA